MALQDHEYNLTTERVEPLYNSKIRPKIADPQVSIIFRGFTVIGIIPTYMIGKNITV